MMILQFGNHWHMFWTIIYLASPVGMHFFLRRKSVRYQKHTLYGLILFNFILHFISPIFSYDNWNERIVTMFIINFCGFLVLTGPVIYFAKDRFLKPAFILGCILGGSLVSINPSAAIGYHAFTINTIRFYVQHILLLTIGGLMLSLDHERIEWRDIWTLPVIVFIGVLIVVANVAILEVWGFIDSMLDQNGLFQWGPYEIEFFALWLTPNFMQRADGTFIPVFWKLPIYVTFYPLFATAVIGIERLIRKMIKKAETKNRLQ